MVYKIIGYGSPILRKKCKDVEDFDSLNEILPKMFKTMYNSEGVGLAAPQVGLDKRIFIIDTTPFTEESDEEPIKKAFINPEIILEEGEFWKFKEGCLSIPDVREDVSRKSKITLKYFDEEGNEHKENFSGITARVIQHEYDHIEGILFVDYLSSLKKRLIKRKLEKITRGEIQVTYPMKFYSSKK